MVSRIKKISSIFLVSIIAIVILVAYSQITPETGQNPYQTITEDPSKAITYDICNGSRGCFNEKVTQIVDGDIIYTQNHKVRLSLTNTPEINEAGFNEATAFTEQLCPIGSTITIDQDDLQPIDPYGRILGKVYCGDKVLNSELLYNNHANILTQYCVTSEFSFEKWAQEFGCGKNKNSQSNVAITQQKKKESPCDPAYPTVCIKAPPPDLDCSDITERNFTVVPPDPHGFDGDKDGFGCES